MVALNEFSFDGRLGHGLETVLLFGLHLLEDLLKVLAHLLSKLEVS